MIKKRLRIFKQSIYKDLDRFEDDINNFILSNDVKEVQTSIHEQYIICLISYRKGKEEKK